MEIIKWRRISRELSFYHSARHPAGQAAGLEGCRLCRSQPGRRRAERQQMRGKTLAQTGLNANTRRAFFCSPPSKSTQQYGQTFNLQTRIGKSARIGTVRSLKQPLRTTGPGPFPLLAFLPSFSTVLAGKHGVFYQQQMREPPDADIFRPQETSRLQKPASLLHYPGIKANYFFN
ncbi:hypothetical protein [uncultured Cohaesibacter sp.]|uniref:hypothetical protein n=1 Tax=uncultured Cohaesibacter sp. TaxID=1002546 RepID=UPI0029C7C5BF|nr:hypothetical protein [uncultured Cohaesibacter sp.]